MLLLSVAYIVPLTLLLIFFFFIARKMKRLFYTELKKIENKQLSWKSYDEYPQFIKKWLNYSHLLYIPWLLIIIFDFWPIDRSDSIAILFFTTLIIMVFFIQHYFKKQMGQLRDFDSITLRRISYQSVLDYLEELNKKYSLRLTVSNKHYSFIFSITKAFTTDQYEILISSPYHNKHNRILWPEKYSHTTVIIGPNSDDDQVIEKVKQDILDHFEAVMKMNAI